MKGASWKQEEDWRELQRLAQSIKYLDVQGRVDSGICEMHVKNLLIMRLHLDEISGKAVYGRSI